MKKLKFILPAITAISILFSSSAISAKTATAKYGDINRDGEINILDLVALKKALANNEDYSVNPLLDCNRDKAVDAKDLTKLKKYLLGADSITQYLIVEQSGSGDNTDFGAAVNG